MEASILNQVFSDQEIKAICWTLIHSLWIGLVIALLCGIIIASTRKSAAMLRYRLLCGLLVLFVFAIGATYYIEASSAAQSPVAGKLQRIFVENRHDVVISHAQVRSEQSLLGIAQAFFNQNTNIIFMIWLLFFMLKSMKMASGLLYIQRIRNYKIHAVTEGLKHRMVYLSNQMGIKRAVRLVQSELVKVPVAVGWLKPMVLLPLGIALQLTPEQLDGILWHELAHIRRRDYLVNILQGLVETVFFFNPGLLWLSSLIRTEREACCDDMVLSRMNQKASYLEALLAFGYGEFKQANLVMGLGSGNELRHRLKRMINQENKRLSIAEKAVLCVGLVLVSAFTTLSKDNPFVKRLHVKFTSPSGKVVQKAISVYITPLKREQRPYDTLSQYKDKRPVIATDTSIHFTSVLFKNNDADPANSEIRAQDDKGNEYHFIVVDDKIAFMELNGNKVDKNKFPDYTYMLRTIEHDIAEKRRFHDDEFARMKAYRKSLDTLGRKFRKDRNWDTTKDVFRLPKKAQDTPEPRYKKFDAMIQREHADSIRYTNQLKRVQNVIANLVADKVVPDAAAVKWFGLSNTEFIVNGQKQTDELQQKYKAKYGVYENYGLYYGPVEMQGTGIFIDEEDQKRTELRRQQFISDKIAMQRFKQLQRREATDVMPKVNPWDDTKDKLQQSATDDQMAKLEQDRKREWLQLKNPGSRGIDLQTPINSLVADLVDANVIGSKSDLVKFNLTNAALMVNDKLQPEELHDKLRAKYLGKPGYSAKAGLTADPNFGLHYNAQSGLMGLGITSDLKGP